MMTKIGDKYGGDACRAHVRAVCAKYDRQRREAALRPQICVRHEGCHRPPAGVRVGRCVLFIPSSHLGLERSEEGAYLVPAMATVNVNVRIARIGVVNRIYVFAGIHVHEKVRRRTATGSL